MTDRRVEEPGRSGPGAAVIAAAVAALVAVRWLARLDWPVLAGIAAAAALLSGAWAVRPKRQLPRHRVRAMRLRARLRLHPGPGHATVFGCGGGGWPRPAAPAGLVPV
jgi:hypothetical protein